ncbi:hypothetical protein [Celeribacter indicus]|uniref:Uncharacterized protein n=1 Tax=Celeribacter indicus TaxID=1208324 RepID=A0A0B5DW91_9RHOB|nr:hypothetical protein [Celeribacter indicus]AJE45420.1 hypothetical protein P73_0705 [Celeribacter indicus]SDX01542.1 hypothetical protein SAMN05443573_11186 [Celeribacter indicus]
MKCLLHIGTEKTGSTSIQDFLVLNRAALSRKGVMVSKALGRGNNRALPACFQGRLDDLSRRLRIPSLEAQKAHFSPILERFLSEVEAARASHDLCLVSSEHLHSRLRSPEEVAALREFLAPHFTGIEVFGYFREQASLVKSNYSTWVEGGGGSASLARFCEEAMPGNPYYDYCALAEMWSAAFGHDSFRPRLYRRDALHGGDVRRDFAAEALKLDDLSDLTFVVTESNRSLGAAGVLIARGLNATLPQFWPGGGRNRLRDGLMRAAVLSGLARIGRLEFPEAAAIRARFEAPNLLFSQRFFGRPDNIFH